MFLVFRALGWSQHEWPEVPLNIAPHPILHLPPPSPEIQALHSSDSDEPKRSLKKQKQTGETMTISIHKLRLRYMVSTTVQKFGVGKTFYF